MVKKGKRRRRRRRGETGTQTIFHPVRKLKECIFNVVEAFWRRFAVLAGPDWRHACDGYLRCWREIERDGR